jgi:hypothetical protein
MRIALYAAVNAAGLWAYFLLADTTAERIAIGLAVLMWLVPATLLGWLAGWVSERRIDIEGTAADVFAWTNLAWWLFPPLGMAASTALGVWAKRSDTRKLRYYFLSCVCGLASIVAGTLSARAAVHQDYLRQTSEINAARYGQPPFGS